MKKIFIILIGVLFFTASFAQKKITELGTAGSADDNSLMYIRQGSSGDIVRKITVANLRTGMSVSTTAQTRTIVADSLNALRANAEQGSTLYPMLADTIPLVTFGVGAGLIADTAVFNNNVLAGSFYNEGSDTLVITQLMGILKEGTGTETISVQVSWHATFLSGSATNLNSSALAITSLTTGTEDTSFANAKIPPNVFVWCILSGASANNKPTFLNVTLSGYKIPIY